MEEDNGQRTLKDNSLYLLNDNKSRPFDLRIVTEKDAPIMSCHSIIIGLWSPVLRACFNDRRFSTNDSFIRIDLKNLDVSAPVFCKFIRSLYYLPDLDPTMNEEYDEETVFDILRISNMYRVDRLVGYCIHFIHSINVNDNHETVVAEIFDSLCNIISVEDAANMDARQSEEVSGALGRFLGCIISKLYDSHNREIESTPYGQAELFSGIEIGTKRKIPEFGFDAVPSFYLKGLERRGDFTKLCKKRLFFEDEYARKKKTEKRVEITWYNSEAFQRIGERLGINSLCWILHLRSRKKDVKMWNTIKGKTALVVMLLFASIHREAREMTGYGEMSYSMKKMIEFIPRLKFKLGVNDEKTFVTKELENVKRLYPRYQETNAMFLTTLDHIKWSI